MCILKSAVKDHELHLNTKKYSRLILKHIIVHRSELQCRLPFLWNLWLMETHLERKHRSRGGDKDHFWFADLQQLWLAWAKHILSSLDRYHHNLMKSLPSEIRSFHHNAKEHRSQGNSICKRWNKIANLQTLFPMSLLTASHFKAHAYTNETLIWGLYSTAYTI